MPAIASTPVRFGGAGARYLPCMTADRDATPIPTSDGAALDAALRVPADAGGLVVFVHGSGSSRFSPRNVAVAHDLERRRFATLLFDLLTDTEERDRRNVFDVDLLARRLADVTRWTRRQPEIAHLPLAYFGASTGAAAALRAAAAADVEVSAVVSRGGRPDLAGDVLVRVAAPTLLIVGGEDREVLALNEEAAALLTGPHEIAVVPGATHLFEEAGALEEVFRLAGEWLERHIGKGGTPERDDGAASRSE